MPRNCKPRVVPNEVFDQPVTETKGSSPPHRKYILCLNKTSTLRPDGPIDMRGIIMDPDEVTIKTLVKE